MKELIFNNGGRPLYADDINVLQERDSYLETFIQSRIGNSANCIIAGCEKELVSPYITVSGGLVFLDGKIRLVTSNKVTYNSSLKAYIVPTSTTGGSLIKYKDNTTDYLYTEYKAAIVFQSEAPSGDYICLDDENINYNDIVLKDVNESLNGLTPYYKFPNELDNIFSFPDGATDSDKRSIVFNFPFQKDIILYDDNINIIGHSKLCINSDNSLVTQYAFTNEGLGSSTDSSNIDFGIRVRYFNLKATGLTLSDNTYLESLTWSEWRDFDKTIKSQIEDLIKNKASNDDLTSLKATVSAKADQTYVDEIYSYIQKFATSTEVQALTNAVAEKASVTYVNEKLAEKQDNLLGEIKMWAGKTVPENYLLCNGAELTITDYQSLYDAIGTTFNTAYVSGSTTKYTTADGKFRLPDLRGRFVVGQSDTSGDYDTLGKAGGAEKVTLTVNEIPSHTHSHATKYTNEEGSSTEAWTVGSGGSDLENTVTWETGATGGGQAHENRPPYYVLAYIIRVK